MDANRLKSMRQIGNLWPFKMGDNDARHYLQLIVITWSGMRVCGERDIGI